MMVAATVAGAAAVATAGAVQLASRSRSHGLWWDGGASSTVAGWSSTRRTLLEMGIDHVVLALNDHADAREGKAVTNWAPAQIVAVARPRRPRVDVMIWAAPTRAFVRSLEEQLPNLKRAGVRVVEFDIERDAWGVSPAGFDSRRAAAIEIARVTRAAGFVVGTTQIVERLYEDWRGLSDYVAVQAYSHARGGEPSYQPGGIYAPGAMQERAAQKVRAYGAPLVQGLYAHDQVFDDLNAEAAMTTAYHAAARTSRVMRWWSSKWVLGHRDNGYSKAVIRQLAREKARR